VECWENQLKNATKDKYESKKMTDKTFALLL
jgi:hypothetical protein